MGGVNPWMAGLVLSALMVLCALVIIRFTPRQVATRSPESYTPEELFWKLFWAGPLAATMLLSEADGYAQTIADVLRMLWLSIFAWVLRRHRPWLAVLMGGTAAALLPLHLALPPPPAKWWAPYAVVGAALWLVLNTCSAWALANAHRLRRADPIPADH